MPDRPWQKLGTDILKLEGEYYLVVTDYFSRYLEIARLNPLTSKTIIGKLREIFARWGIPEEIVSDNGGQFTSTYFKEFAKQYGFTHTTVSPHFPQANGAAESAVKIAKRILRQPDIFLALMAYRSTPITATGVSPAELLMGRKIKTTLPSHPNKLKPKWPNLRKVKERDGVYKTKSKINYDKRHGSKDLKPLRVGDRIREKTDEEKMWRNTGIVTATNKKNRTYTVKLNSGESLKRNRKHLLPILENVDNSSRRSEVKQKQETTVSSRGRLSKKPNYLKDFVCKDNKCYRL